MTDPDVMPIVDCLCGHGFLRHHLNGRERLADACLTPACGCLTYRPPTTRDNPDEGDPA